MVLLRVFQNTKSPLDMAAVAASAKSRGVLRITKMAREECNQVLRLELALVFLEEERVMQQ